MSDKSTQIHLKVSERSFLRGLQLPGETYGQTIIRLGDENKNKTMAVHLPAGLYNLLCQVAEGLKKEARVVNVDSLAAAFFVKTGAWAGFKGETFWDWGTEEVAKANLITLYGIDDDYNVLNVILTQTMNTLIERFGASEFEPILEQTLEAIEAAYTRLFPEDGENPEDGEDEE